MIVRGPNLGSLVLSPSPYFCSQPRNHWNISCNLSLVGDKFVKQFSGDYYSYPGTVPSRGDLFLLTFLPKTYICTVWPRARALHQLVKVKEKILLQRTGPAKFCGICTAGRVKKVGARTVPLVWKGGRERSFGLIPLWGSGFSAKVFPITPSPPLSLSILFFSTSSANPVYFRTE